MRGLLTVMAFAGAFGCGGKARYFTPSPDAGPGEDAAVPADAGLDAAPDAGVDSGCHDDLDHDGVDSPACGGGDCNDADPTIKPRAEDPGEWLFERADELGWAVAPSVAVTADGVPHLLFEDRTLHAVVEAQRSSEGQWTRLVVEDRGGGPSAALGVDGLVHAVFVGAGADPPVLRHAVFAAGAWVVETAVPGVSLHTPVRPALASGPGDVLVAAFADEGPDGAVVRLATAEAGEWRDEVVAVDGGGAEPTDGRVALAVDAEGAPWVAWELGGAIRVATRAGEAWDVQTLPLSGPATAPAIARSAAGALAVSYRDQATRALGLARGTEGAWTSEVVDDRHGAGLVSALVFDPAGAVHLLYSAPDRFDTRWATDAYGEWLVVTIDRSAEPDVALAIDANGADHMVYPTSDSDLRWSRHVGGDGIDQDCDGMPDSG